MPYDSADQIVLPTNSESHASIPSGSGSGILAQMKDAGRSLVHSVKRKATSKVLAAFMVASAALLAPQIAKGQDTVAIITGTVSSGTDTTGVFGAPGSLTGEPFTLTLPIDSSKGSQTSSTCGYGEYYSNISLNTSAPVTAVLEIGSSGGKFDFGGGAPVYSYAMRYSQPCYYSVAGFGVQVNYTGALYGTAYVGNTSGPNVWAVPWTTGVLSPSADWSYPIASASANTAYPFPFSISITLSGSAYKGASGSLAPATLTVQDTSSLGELLGCPSCLLGGFLAGDPINPANGNVYETVTDYTTTGTNPLAFTRYYNSKGNAIKVAALLVTTNATTLGTNWRSNYDGYIQVVSSTVVNVERPNGQVLQFTQSGGVWSSNTDIDIALTQSGSTFTLTDSDDNVESYSVTGSKGVLQSITARNGYTQTLSYTSGQLTTVTDSYSRTLTLTYNGSGQISTVSTPDGLTLTYGYNSSGQSGGGVLDRLASVSYSTSPVTNQTYLYENGAYPYALTGVTDEDGNRFSTWAYDANGRGISSQTGSSANATTLSYGSTTTTVTNAFGVADTYTFTTLQGVPKVTSISRAATGTTAAAVRTLTYDTNGFLASETDWNGNLNTYTNNSHGLPTTTVEASGSPVARTTTIAYDPTFVHLPDTVTTPGLTTTYSYDGSGNVLTKTDTDTTSNSVPYSTNGQTRVTTYTWSGTGQELTVQLPRTDLTAKTTYAYTSGALTSITDALGHVTTISSYTGGGLPLTVVDPNSVTTTMTYDGRMRLNTSTLHRGAGNLVTTWTHDAAGNLTSFEKPDGSTLSYAYDTAHRLTTVTDLPGNTINYTLDALGDRTATQVKNTGGTVKESHSATFDALGRKLTDVGGMSQTTTFTYDANGNILTVTDPLSNTVTKTYDALNRLSTSVDPSPGGTTTTAYDAHNRPTSVTDANGNATTYVYNGFGDRTQTASPDSGTAVFHYDPDRNLTQKVLPGSMTMNATFDALDRPLTNTYPSDSTLNVSRTYDQTSGHGFGVGRLTSATDQPGSLSLTYDERGNVTAESRTVTSAGTLAASTTFDGANNVSSITYPSGTVVNYTRNSMGLVTSITAQLPGAGSPSNVATSITYEPFGPETSLTFGNGITGTYSYDADYRPTSRVDAASSNVLSLAYTYFANNSVHAITDSVNTANSQTLGYDVLDRLTSAVSGAGGYGTWSWTWDPVGNVQTQVINGTTTTLSQTSGTNILSQFVTSGTTTTVASTGTGNINTLTVGGTPVDTFTYNQANQLASATSTSSNASYKYDLDGQRIEKSPPGVYPVLYQYGQAAKELLSENDLHSGTAADYIYLNGRPIGQVDPTSGSLYFTHSDKLGTVNTITDGSKGVVWSAIYNPFGDNPIAGVSGTLTTQSLRLPGQVFDVESGLSHNGFRNYAGTLTRYIESDPIGLKGGMNTFQYVKGNAFKNIDPKGEKSIGDIVQNWWDSLTPTDQHYYECNIGLGGVCIPVAIMAPAGSQLPVGVLCRLTVFSICGAACGKYSLPAWPQTPTLQFPWNPQGTPLLGPDF
jgi:RHS repeat-associated protein